jgi:hypothetical protein
MSKFEIWKLLWEKIFCLTINKISVRATFKEFFICYHNFLIFFKKDVMALFVVSLYETK